MAGIGATSACTHGDDVPEVCGGVGLEGPLAPTPEEAMAAWLDEQHAEPPMSAWTMTELHVDEADGTRSVAFRSEQSGWASIGLTAVASDDAEGWRVTGGCVGVGGPPG